MQLKKHLFLILLLGFSLPIFSQNEKDRPLTYEDDLSINWKESEDSLSLFIRNKLLVSLELILYDRANDEELRSFHLRPMDSLKVFARKLGKKDSIPHFFHEKYRLAYFFGHPDQIRHDDSFLYQFPFERGKKFKVSQGWHGKRTHKKPPSAYAIDFLLQVGDPVYAARGGMVIKAIDWFTKQGGPELVKAANRIVILHNDGTMASYVHLIYKGVLVKEGDRIQMGQKIGYSGLTGYTNGTHLHFVVRKERDLSIPIYFQRHEQKELKMGKKYSYK